MARACIITYDEYSNIPYVKDYENILVSKGIIYDIVLWNRSKSEDSAYPKSPENVFAFTWHTRKSKLSKLRPFLEWRRFVLKILMDNKYDFLIVCTTIPAVLLYNTLIKNFTGKFVFDIRDYTYENFMLYRNMTKKLTLSSGLTCISSKGFLDWLPCNVDKYIVTHNIAKSDIEWSKSTEANAGRQLFNRSKPVKIGFVGGIRYYDANVKLINAFANHSDFELVYAGKFHPGCDLEGYCKDNGILNVSFLPRFTQEEKPMIYQSIDIINSVYGNETLEVRTALPNRLYDSVVYKIPIMVTGGTFLSSIVETYNLGLNVTIESKNILLQTQEYIRRFDEVKFTTGCQDFFSYVIKEKEHALEQISEFISYHL